MMQGGRGGQEKARFLGFFATCTFLRVVSVDTEGAWAFPYGPKSLAGPEGRIAYNTCCAWLRGGGGGGVYGG